MGYVDQQEKTNRTMLMVLGGIALAMVVILTGRSGSDADRAGANAAVQAVALQAETAQSSATFQKVDAQPAQVAMTAGNANARAADGSRTEVAIIPAQ